jgi:hypothetical protein
LSDASPAPGAPAPLWSRLAGLFFGLDLRSLALFRVGLAVLLLADLAGRWPDLEAHYSDNGVLPRVVFDNGVPRVVAPAYVPLPLHSLGGSAEYEGFLFVVAGAVAVALLVGYRTTLATFFSWLLLLSLHARNPLVLHGGDLLERMLLFWAMFLPLGARWSLDARRAGAASPGGGSVCTVATAALMLQVVFVYWFGLASRTSPVWWGEGTAVAQALSLDFYATPLTAWARGLPPELLRFATFATVAVEGGGPLLLLLSGRMGRLRTAVVALMIAFHVMLGLFLRLGTFPLACAVAWLPFLPAPFWDALLPRVGRLVSRRPQALPAPSASEGSDPSLALGAGEEPTDAAPAPTGLSPLAAVLVVVSLAYVVYCNVQGLRQGFVLSVVKGVGIEQSWGMFAPQPSRDDGWYVVVGRQEDGKEVDPFRDGPVSWDPPERISVLYPNVRWAAYLTALHWPGNERFQLLFANSLGQRWNAHHTGGEAVESVEVYYMLRFIRPDYTKTDPRKVSLVRVERAP